MAEADPIAELAQLTGGPSQAKTYGGRAVTISPLVLEEFEDTLEAIQPIFGDLVSLAQSGDISEASVAVLYIKNAKAFRKAVCIAARIDPDWLGKQTLDVPLELFADLLECNRDFFATRLQPMLLLLQTRRSAGSMSPSASSAAATGTPT